MSEINMIAKYHNIELQKEGESDDDYRRRVSGELRDKGLLIEAHEVYHGKRWNESADVMTGVKGALAMALQGVDYGSKGERKIGDDIAAGTIIENPREEPDLAMLLLAMMMRD